MLLDGESIDIIPGTSRRIIQNRAKFSYGTDAILLSEFARAKGQVLDLGTGTAIIPLRIYREDLEGVYGLEIQEEVCTMARRSLALNGLEDRIEIVHGDLREIESHFSSQSMDTVVSNPPYMKLGDGDLSKGQNFAISKHELKSDLGDVLRAAAYVLKPLGRFFMVHRMDRIVDIACGLREHGLEPKYIRFVSSNIEARPHLVLVEARKSARPGLKVGRPIYIYDLDGNYSEEILELYGRKDD